jgi:hypothetical protein
MRANIAHVAKTVERAGDGGPRRAGGAGGAGVGPVFSGGARG